MKTYKAWCSGLDDQRVALILFACSSLRHAVSVRAFDLGIYDQVVYLISQDSRYLLFPGLSSSGNHAAWAGHPFACTKPRRSLVAGCASSCVGYIRFAYVASCPSRWAYSKQ